MTDQRPHAVIVQRAIRQYRVPFLEALKADLQARGIELSVVHNTPTKDDDPRRDVAGVAWGNYAGARSIRLGGKALVWQQVPSSVWKADLVVVEQATQLLLNYALLARRRLGGPMVGLWGHGVSPYRDANQASEAVKRIASREPDWWFAYTDGVAERVRGFGFPADRITSVRNAIDVRRLEAEVAAVPTEEVERVREHLGLRGRSVGLFVGALVPEKRLDFLLAAGASIHAVHPEFELVIAGDGTLRTWVAEQARAHPWLHYAGQRFGPDLAALLKVATVLMIPHWVGLVVTDSFAAATPLAVSQAAAHGPEVEYLRHRENSLWINDGGDPRRYAQELVAAMEEPGLLERLAQGCREDACRYGTEDMAARFAQGVASALAAGPRGERRRTPVRRAN